MNISKSFKDYIGVILAGVFLIGSYSIGKHYERPFIFISKQEKSINLNNDFLNRFNLGLKSLISSSLWIATIVESDHEHYKNKDLNSWMFLRFNTIRTIDPKFYENYVFGGPYLSIIKDDLEGASIIYDKGLEQYPDDFALLRDSGFHYYFEVGDHKKALKSYQKLARDPRTTPVMMTTLARINTGEGRLEDAYFLLLGQLERMKNKNSYISRKLVTYLYAIKAEIDLKCLNGSDHKTQCSQLDFNGNRYILKNNQYIAKEIWVPFRRK
jgi:tetratricopeptide (TPR) repeat protein